MISGKAPSDDGGGWTPRPGVEVYNLYRPAIVKAGEISEAQRWIDHIELIFDDEAAQHIVKWCAHRVQRPGDKINHALVLGGKQGVGKGHAARAGQVCRGAS